MGQFYVHLSIDDYNKAYTDNTASKFTMQLQEFKYTPSSQPKNQDGIPRENCPQVSDNFKRRP